MSNYRNFTLNHLWNLRVYSQESKVFQNKNQLLILGEENKVLLNLKVLESGRIALQVLDENVFCEFGNNTVHFSEDDLCKGIEDEEYLLSYHDVNTVSIKKAKRLIEANINICEECLGKSLDISQEKQLTLIGELLQDEEIYVEKRLCDLCGDNKDCILLVV